MQGWKIIPQLALRRFKKLGRIIRQRYFQDFIFIHINRTGGSSIEKALGIPLEHMSAEIKIRELGLETWENKFTFSVIRNPWDKVVSHYWHRWNRDQAGIQTDEIGFSEWVQLTYGQQDPRYYNKPKMFQPQVWWLADQAGKILVDKVIRFESLETGFNEVCQHLGITRELPHLKSSPREDYRHYYSPETRAIVQKWFNEDLEEFDYEY